LKKRLLALAMAGSALGALGVGLTTTAATADSCGTTAPTPGSPSVPLPDGGTVWASGSGTSGSAGIAGPHGYLYAQGSASGGTIQGSSTDVSQLNGRMTVSTSPTVCIAGASA